MPEGSQRKFDAKTRVWPFEKLLLATGYSWPNKVRHPPERAGSILDISVSSPSQPFDAELEQQPRTEPSGPNAAHSRLRVLDGGNVFVYYLLRQSIYLYTGNH
jgi:hypothetical protein